MAMSKYMVVYKTDDGKTGASFYDDYTSARNAMIDMECGLGWYSELYERQTTIIEGLEEIFCPKEYVFVEA